MVYWSGRCRAGLWVVPGVPCSAGLLQGEVSDEPHSAKSSAGKVLDKLHSARFAAGEVGQSSSLVGLCQGFPQPSSAKSLVSHAQPKYSQESLSLNLITLGGSLSWLHLTGCHGVESW